MTAWPNIAEIWSDFEPYILQTFLAGIALFTLLKDWEEYKKKLHEWVCWTLLSATVVVWALTLYETHHTRQETRQQETTAKQNEARSEAQIQTLTQQVRQEREENRHNSDGFRESFDSLYQKYSALAAQVQNADLLREIKQTRSELRVTQDRLTQPRPRLTASFWKQDMNINDLRKEIDVVKAQDGSVSFDIITANDSDVAALRGAVNVRICWACKYASEPDSSTRVPGSQETDRALPFEHVLSHSLSIKSTIAVVPEAFVQRFLVEMTYACENCSTDTQKLTVNIVPALPFPR